MATSTYDVLLLAPAAYPAKVLADDVFQAQMAHGWHPVLTSTLLDALKVKTTDLGAGQGEKILEWLSAQPLFATLFGLAILWTILFPIIVKRPGAHN